MKSAVSYDKNLRENAKKEQHVLVTFDMDCRNVPPGALRIGRMTQQMTLPVDIAEQMLGEIQRLYSLSKARADGLTAKCDQCGTENVKTKMIVNDNDGSCFCNAECERDWVIDASVDDEEVE